MNRTEILDSWDRVRAYRDQQKLLEETYVKIEDAFSVANQYELHCIGELRNVLHEIAVAIDQVEDRLTKLHASLGEVEVERY